MWGAAVEVYPGYPAVLMVPRIICQRQIGIWLPKDETILLQKCISDRWKASQPDVQVDSGEVGSISLSDARMEQDKQSHVPRGEEDTPRLKTSGIWGSNFHMTS